MRRDITIAEQIERLEQCASVVNSVEITSALVLKLCELARAAMAHMPAGDAVTGATTPASVGESLEPRCDLCGCSRRSLVSSGSGWRMVCYDCRDGAIPRGCGEPTCPVCGPPPV